MHRFTDMHCGRAISEKIHKKRTFSPLPISIQVIRLRGAGCGREEMLSSHITDPKPNEKSRVTQKLPQYRQRYTLETDSHALSTGSFFLS